MNADAEVDAATARVPATASRRAAVAAAALLAAAPGVEAKRKQAKPLAFAAVVVTGVVPDIVDSQFGFTWSLTMSFWSADGDQVAGPINDDVWVALGVDARPDIAAFARLRASQALGVDDVRRVAVQVL